MSLTARWALVVLGLAGPVYGQGLTEQEKPAKHVPRKPLSRQDLDRQDAQRLYGVGLLHERGNRLVEAVRALEEAQKLDPRSAAIPRALYGLYFALDRTEDGLVACRKVLKLDPEDGQTAYAYARQLRGLDRWKDAIAA